ncbi:MAG: hypothetical protein PHD51_00265 [Patescibacteria group bacterium]|nr:hypothetical protein [Patescibacteria group bacterium]MDD5490697.1 hypothetical protein [Patescibacteria group bacterium]
MINKKFFAQLRKDFLEYVGYRRQIIRYTGDALHKSKQAIFSLHRENLAEAKKTLGEVEAIFADLKKKIKNQEILNSEGSYRAAVEEYVEAKLFCMFLEKGKIGEIKEMEINFDSYIGGVCDLTGEIVRRAINQANKGNYKAAEEAKDVLEEIMAELIQMNLTSYLRVKYDQAKHNLKKIEEILYDIKIRRG